MLRVRQGEELVKLDKAIGAEAELVALSRQAARL
jgi:hypothetical protein